MDPKNIVKVGHQDPNDPLKFILSTADVDRMGDIVDQDHWQLADFKKNPIALFMHDHKAPIGVWKNVRVEGGKLVGYLQLAKEGTSEFIDGIRSLVEQKILKAVSVGFSVKDYERMVDDEGYTTGYRLLSPSLHEASLVSVPANQNALQTAKSLQLCEEDIAKIFVAPEKSAETGNGLNQSYRNRLALAKVKSVRDSTHQP